MIHNDYKNNKIKQNKKLLNIDSLDDNIKQKIILNKQIIYDKNNYIEEIIPNNEILSINKDIENECINKSSIYNDSIKIKIDDYECILLEINNNIYKYYPGFFTFSQFNKYINEKTNRFTSFTSKYIAFNESKTNYTGLVSYKLLDKLVLLDLFNINNIKLLINLIKKLSVDDYMILLDNKVKFDKLIDNNIKLIDEQKLKIIKEKMIEYLEIISGYNKTFEDQIKYYDKLYNKKLIYYLKTEKIYNKSNYCDMIKEMNIIYINKYDNILFNMINHLIPEIDGFIKKQLYSNFNNVKEEIYIRHISLHKLMYDKEDKLTWLNWRIKVFNNNKLYKGLIMRLLNTIDIFGKNNHNFSLIKYYVSNNISSNIIKKKINIINNNNQNNNKYILSYDVSEFKCINKNISYNKNILRILDLISIINKYTNKNLHYIYLMNVLFKDDDIYNKFKEYLDRLGFKFYIRLQNNNNEILFISKDDNHNYYKINMINVYDNIKKEITNNTFNDKILKLYNESLTENNNLIIEIKNIKLSCILLKKPLQYNTEYDDYLNMNKDDIISKFKKINSLTHINELDRIIYEKSDIIIGNFNFSLYDDNNNLNNEVKKLTLNNYLNYNNNLEKYSTINKRIDHTYSRIKLNMNNIIKCNYTYNLPLLQIINI